MVYNWQASLLMLVSVIVLTVVGKFLVFRIPALRQAREHNLAEDAVKLAKAKYPLVIKQSKYVGLVLNTLFFAVIVPLVITLDPQPVWKVLTDIVAILMVYDFFYYLTHRFLFHGQSFLRQVHALHHQARNPTHIDAFYVHPLETGIGIALFILTPALLAPLMGPFHGVTLTVTYIVFVQLNTINHTRVELPYFPFRTLTWITRKHAVHHENMHKGNYATITLLYDKLFGTLD